MREGITQSSSAGSRPPATPRAGRSCISKGSTTGRPSRAPGVTAALPRIGSASPDVDPHALLVGQLHAGAVNRPIDLGEVEAIVAAGAQEEPPGLALQEPAGRAVRA